MCRQRRIRKIRLVAPPTMVGRNPFHGSAGDKEGAKSVAL
ncbi:hypothetical protein NEISUBOT_05116 [Neisseria subflava NJ9703]|uniref:Uncharacterized protein n=1 Tax=Neisseria subflava NJ9703 TaxID=546268 RepID=A0A9W5IPG5_NEISU|nr:hypothetical protein NEISUBOT_05116 [Neisseria subflava NJ9703]